MRQIHRYLFAKCGRTGKELRFTLLGTVRIYLNGKILAEFVDLSKAVEFFNNINKIFLHEKNSFNIGF